MIEFRTGNLFESNAEALVNTVNTVGVMGKGIALQFKKLFPNNFKIYAKACKSGEMQIGKLLVTEEETLLQGKKVIINFPTKTDWRKASEYAYIDEGLKTLAKEISNREIKSIAIPALGSGNGGLAWDKVKSIIVENLAFLPCEILVYLPNENLDESSSIQLVALTPARAMLLSVMYDMVKNGESISEFAAEKIAYFLQRFGAQSQFKLNFTPNFYGPYSGKVRHVLHLMNGSYISGYSAKDKRPFDELSLLMDKEPVVTAFLDQPENGSFREISHKTKAFLKGFYSSFALELLSSVDFLHSTKRLDTTDEISIELELWSDRKKSLFQNKRYIDLALETIKTHLPVT